MGYSVKNMGKAYAEGNYRTALNNAAHLVKDEAKLEIIKEAYEMVKAGTVEGKVVSEAIKEVEVMLGIENKAVETVETTEEVEVMANENEKATEVEVTAEATEPKADPWILVTGKKKSKDLYMTVFEGDSRAKLNELQKAGYTFVCLATVSRFLKLLATNWKGGREVIKNLSKKDVANVDEFVNNILDAYNIYGNTATVAIDAEGKLAPATTEDNEEEKAA